MRVHALKQYLPAIGMVVAAVLTYVVSALADNVLSTQELGTVILTLAGAVLVYIVPRFESVKWLKPLIAVVVAVVNAWLAAATGGVTASEYLSIILGGLGALGVVATNGSVPLTADYTPRHVE